jgi:putative serine protease PepD
MLRKTTAAFVAAAAIAGASIGIGTYAAVTVGHHTTTVVEHQVSPSPAASTTSGSVGSVYKSARSGVVEITTTTTASNNNGGNGPFPFDGSQQSQAEGSGFVYDTSGHIITNYHVVQGASAITVAFPDGSKYKATIVGSDASTDLGVLKVDAPANKLHPLSLGDSSSLSVGDGVVAIGSPFGLEETVTSGIVSALNRTISSLNQYSIAGAIQTDAAINHGNSGGPLLDLSGQVVGVNSQIESESGGNEGVGFAIPSNTVKSVVTQLIGGDTVKHAFLGVFVGTSTSRGGAQISRVQSGSPAAKAGLKSGDVITTVDGNAITTADDLTAAVSARQPGDHVTITYVRDGKTKTAKVTLGNRSS